MCTEEVVETEKKPKKGEKAAAEATTTNYRATHWTYLVDSLR